MVRKTQKKFIALLMSILFFVFCVIFLGVFIISSIGNDKIITTRIDDAKSTYERQENSFLLDGSIYAKVDFNQVVDGKHPILFIEFDENAFTSEQAKNLVNGITKNHDPFGDVGNYYYKIFPTDVIVFCDTTDVANSQRGTLVSTAIILGIIYLALFLTVWGVSFKIVQPLQDSLDKQLQFISNASHELKTPITVISANADVIKMQNDCSWVDNIKSQTERMQTLVNDMLMLAKVDEGALPLKPEEFNLSDEIVGAILPFDELAFEQGKHLEMYIPKDVSFYGDRNSIKTLLSILIDNAIKYSNEDGLIKVSLKKDKKTTITVFNTGSEIKEQDAEKMFTRFYRGDNSRARETGGSGLGLAIAKGIADNNKWKITAKSEYGASMQITITL